MILDKNDKKKTNLELQLEIEELKKMRNRDDDDIKLLKVELQKLEIVFKKYKDVGGFNRPGTQYTSMTGALQQHQLIKLPQRFMNQMNKQSPGP